MGALAHFLKNRFYIGEVVYRGEKPKGDPSDRGVIDRYVTRIIVRPNSIDMELREPTLAPAPLPATNAPTTGTAASSTCTTVISLPWSAPAFPSTHTGEHASIIDRPTFEAVQAKLAENARARRARVENSPAILMGRIFDDRGNRMTPSHSNKDGVRYRYYVSHVLLQRRKKDAGRVTRVPAIPLEKLVVEAIRAEARPDTASP